MILPEPDLLLLGGDAQLVRHDGLGLDAGGLGRHVAVDEDGVLRVSTVGVDPVLTWSHEGIIILQDDGMKLQG